MATIKPVILFTQKNSTYNKLHCECYDINRDATTYKGEHSIIAHPPCRSWGRLYKLAKPKFGERRLAIWSVLKIRTNGGILEHPAGSKLWQSMNLPKPGKTDTFGFSVSINQHWFGHLAQKNTWLYICGLDIKDLPALELNFNAVTHLVCSTGPKDRRVKKLLSSKGREMTPASLAQWFFKIIEIIEKNKHENKI